jgi:hypothetical protein
MACKTYYVYFISIYGLDDYSYLSMLCVYEMKYVIVHLYPCCIDVIFCIFTICYTILSHDYTHSFRHSMFCKIIQLSSHMPLSVIFAIINPCIYLGGAPYTNLENKTLLCLIVKKNSKCLSSITKNGEIENASRPPCGF